MHVRILYADRRWPRVENHLDSRVCPICSATVHGRAAQRGHLQWHADLSSPAAGDPGDGPPVPWTAAVDEQDDQEAADG